MTIQTSYLAAEAVGAIMQEAAGGFTIRNTSQGVILRAWLPGDESLDPQIDALRARFAALPDELLEDGLPTIELSWVDEENWAESWKSHWRAVRLGRRIVVKPSWQPWPPEDQPDAAQADDIVVELDPGMAFGTGAHATTALCLGALEDYVEPGMEIVDLGCGSGILTVAALKLGAKSVLAIDTDILAVEATERNCEINGVTGCTVLQQEGIGATHGQFDLIVGNISQKIVKLEAPLIPERLRPGGIFIASGFYVGYEDDIVEALRDTGFEVIRTIERDMWACVIGRKND